MKTGWVEYWTYHLAAGLLFRHLRFPQDEQEREGQAEGTGRQAGWAAGQVNSLHEPSIRHHPHIGQAGVL
jgi:hypothetical protein